MLSIGLMSGTSMDGIDASLLETDGTEKNIRELGYISIPYTSSFQILLKTAEYAVRKCLGDRDKAEKYFVQAINDYLTYELKLSPNSTNHKIIELSDYSFTLNDVIQHSTELHAQAVKKLLEKTGYPAKHIDVIGYHGQTLFHRPSEKISVIVGDGQYLANQLGITVVNDFRSRDIAAGGQGAPFAPLYHYALAIRDQKIPAAIVNCGGIANITLVNSTHENDLIAFDTGPGNILIDRVVRQRTHGKENQDTDAQYGKQGKINTTVFQLLYEKLIIKNGENYFTMKPPKSLDIGDIDWLPELNAMTLQDACATLEAFTADTIANSLELLNIESPRYWILAGGGWNNPVILQELKERLNKKFLHQIKIQTANEIGWNSTSMEAQIFAYLAVRRLQNKPLSLPNTTGVPKPLSGGHINIPSTAKKFFLSSDGLGGYAFAKKSNKDVEKN